MNNYSLQFKTFILSFTGVVLGAAVGYYVYKRSKKRAEDDKDEGIGDVDSIVSEEEVEHSIKSPIDPANQNLFGQPSRDNDLANTLSGISSSELIKSDPIKVLLLGLNGCGKTSMLNLLAHNIEPDTYQPTNGFHTIQVEKSSFVLSIVEVGGGKTVRPYWKKFTKDCCVLVYIVDGSDKSLFKEAKSAFKELLDDSDSLKDVRCLLVSNQKDSEDACKADEIFNEKFVNEIAKRGVTNITLLNTQSLVERDSPSNRDVIMDVIISLSKEATCSV